MNYVEKEPSKDEQLSRGLGISFAVHAFIISVFTLKTVFFSPEPIDFSQAVRVDIVGLPDKIQPETLPPPAKEEAKAALPEKAAEKEKTPPPPPPKPEPAKPVAKKEEGVNLNKVKEKQQSAIEKLKAMAALEKIKEDVAREKKQVPSNGKSNTGSAVVKGNVLSPGTSLTGLTKLQHDTYASDLDQHIKRNWSLPEWLANRDFKAQARVYIDSRGNILGRKIVKSSGNPDYDQEVLTTIDNSAPFPPPPEKFLAIVSVDGILIGFPE